jgi:hypothetical protein
MLTKEQKEQFNEILDELGANLDISETEFDAAVQSYKAVGTWLCNDGSLLKPYNPTVKPQGSMILGTTVKPIDPKLDLDLDIVCELSGKDPKWTQKDLKEIVGEQLESHKTYEALLDKEGRRCWTLKYRQNSQTYRYHMDILPAIIAFGYNILLEKSFSNQSDLADLEKLSIRITDNNLVNYPTQTNPDAWLISNPFGYAKWFMNKAIVALTQKTKMFSLSEAVKPLPKYQNQKYPLQRVVQILKRHRDMMFSNDPDRPISIIITTLAAKAYRGQINIHDALVDIIDRMPMMIDTKYDEYGIQYKYIGNPALPNSIENFADKWRETKKKEDNFYKWILQLRADIENASIQKGPAIQESLAKVFGQAEVSKTFSNIGQRKRLLTEQGANRLDPRVGLVPSATIPIKPHHFYGTED